MSGHSLTDAERGGERLGVEAGRETWIDLVRREFGPVSVEQADSLLWNATAFPFVDADHIAAQLREARRLSGGSVVGSLILADLEMSAAMLPLCLPRSAAVPASPPPNEVGTE